MKHTWSGISSGVTSEEEFANMFAAAETTEQPSTETVEETTEEVVVEPPVVIGGMEGKLKSEQEFAEQFGEPEVVETTEEGASTETTTAKPVSKSIDAAFLKATATYKAEKYGIDLSEVGDAEWTPERFAELEDMIDDIRLEEKYSSMKSSEPFFEAILDVVENGGDPNQLLQLLAQKKELSDFDTSTLDGKVNKIKSYYKNIEKKSPEWIDRQIVRITAGEDANEVDEELKLIDSEYEKHFEKQKQEQVKRAEAENQARIENHKRQVETFTTTLKSKKFSEKEVNELSSFVYDDQKWKMKGSNQTFSDFDYSIMKAKANPDELADLVLFLKDKTLYNKKVVNSAKNVSTENAFKTIVDKTANSLAGAPGNTQSDTKKHKFKFQL